MQNENLATFLSRNSKNLLRISDFQGQKIILRLNFTGSLWITTLFALEIRVDPIANFSFLNVFRLT